MMDSGLDRSAGKREQVTFEVDDLKRDLLSEFSTLPDSQVNLVMTGEFTIISILLPTLMIMVSLTDD